MQKSFGRYLRSRTFDKAGAERSEVAMVSDVSVEIGMVDKAVEEGSGADEVDMGEIERIG